MLDPSVDGDVVDLDPALSEESSTSRQGLLTWSGRRAGRGVALLALVAGQDVKADQGPTGVQLLAEEQPGVEVLAARLMRLLCDGARSALVTRFRYTPAALRPTPALNKIGRSSPFAQEGTACAYRFLDRPAPHSGDRAPRRVPRRAPGRPQRAFRRVDASPQTPPGHPPDPHAPARRRGRGGARGAKGWSSWSDLELEDVFAAPQGALDPSDDSADTRAGTEPVYSGPSSGV